MFKLLTLVSWILLGWVGAGQAQGPTDACQNGVIYQTCGDQQWEAYQRLLKATKEAGQPLYGQKIMLIFGMDSCPWCRSLHRTLVTAASDESKALLRDRKLNLLEIGMFDSGNKFVPSGYRVFVQALLQSIDLPRNTLNGQLAFPLIVIMDPIKRATVLIKTGALEKNSGASKGHDLNKISDAIDAGLKKLNELPSFD